MTTKLKLSATPKTRRRLNLADPIWTIHHIAQAFNLSIDRARHHTRRDKFPRPKAGFETHCWCREAVLAWFRQLPDLPRPQPKSRPAKAAVPATTPRASVASPSSSSARRPNGGRYRPRPAR